MLTVKESELRPASEHTPITLVESDALLLPLVGSVVPLGAVTVAVLVREPLAAVTVPVIVNVTEPLLGRVGMTIPEAPCMFEMTVATGVIVGQTAEFAAAHVIPVTVNPLMAGSLKTAPFAGDEPLFQTVTV